MRPRLSISRMILLVLALGVAFASLRAASQSWANATLTAVICLLTVALVVAACRRDRLGAFWSGFAIGGWLYLTAACGPFFESSIGRKLLTTAVLDLAYEHIARPEPAAPPPFVSDLGRWGRDFAALEAESKAQMQWYESLGLGRDFYGWGSREALHSTTEFRRIGHAWFTALVAGLPGLAAVRYYDSRPREEDEP